MHCLPLPGLALGLLLMAAAASAHTVVVTESDNEQAVTLSRGDVLQVRLAANMTTGYAWYVVYDPTGPLSLDGQPRYASPAHPPGIIGHGGTQEFCFIVPEAAPFERGGWLRLMSLRPFEPGVKDAKLWEIKYMIKANRS